MSHAARRAAGSKPDGRLVEEHQLGIADQRQRQVEPPLLAARQRARAAVGGLVEPGERDTSSTSRGAGYSDAQCATVSRTLRCGYVPQLCSTIPTRSRSVRRPLARVVSEHRHRAAAARAVALEDLDRRRLAGAVGPEQPEHLAAARPRSRCPRTASWPS